MCIGGERQGGVCSGGYEGRLRCLRPGEEPVPVDTPPDAPPTPLVVLEDDVQSKLPDSPPSCSRPRDRAAGAPAFLVRQGCSAVSFFAGLGNAEPVWCTESIGAS